jgi:glutaryl-CoA dehydrogenase
MVFGDARQGIQKDEHSALAKAYTTAKMLKQWPGAGGSGGNGIVLEYGVARHFADN